MTKSIGAEWPGFAVHRTLRRKIFTQILLLREASATISIIHPRQEEVIYVLDDEIEQWLEAEKRTLKKGRWPSSLAPWLSTVPFNIATKTAQLMVVLSPSVTDGGYEMVDVSNEAPWNALRK